MSKLFIVVSILCFIQVAQADVTHVSSAICKNLYPSTTNTDKVIFLRNSHFTNGVPDSNEMLVVFLNTDKKSGKEYSYAFALVAELKIAEEPEGFKVRFIKSPFDDVNFPTKSGTAEVEIMMSKFKCDVSLDF